MATDLAEQELARALEQAGHLPRESTTWVWEGVVPYPSAVQVRATLAVLGSRSAPGSRLVIDYQAPSTKAHLGRLLGRVLMRTAGGSHPWRDEPHRSHWSPEQIATLLDEHRFRTLRDHDLLEIAAELGLPPGAGDLGNSLANGRVLVADRHRAGSRMLR